MENKRVGSLKASIDRPKILKLSAESQKCKGGFWRYGSPCILRFRKSPLSYISRLTAAYLAESTVVSGNKPEI